jgi:hypothetical protein
MLLILTSVAVRRDRRKTMDVMNFMVVAWAVQFGDTESTTMSAARVVDCENTWMQAKCVDA